jgi:hypothetical protein
MPWNGDHFLLTDFELYGNVTTAVVVMLLKNAFNILHAALQKNARKQILFTHLWPTMYIYFYTTQKTDFFTC